jgi:hypothetical protein
MFLVERSGRLPDETPLKGVSFNGQRRDIDVSEIIAAEGRRSPDHTVAQRTFRMAVVLVVREGTEPTADELTVRSSNCSRARRQTGARSKPR